MSTYELEQKLRNLTLNDQRWLDGVRVHSASSQYDYTTFNPSNVVEPSKTYWLSQQGLITNQWLIFDFGKPTFVTKLGIRVDKFECTLKDFYIEVSNNDDMYSWRVIKAFQAQCGLYNQGEQSFEGFQFSGRYMRLFAKDNWGPGGGNYILISKVRFFGADPQSVGGYGQPQYGQPQPQYGQPQQGGMPRTMNWLDGVPRIHSVSSIHSEPFSGNNVLDRSKTYWLSQNGVTTNQWLVFDLSKKYYVNKLTIRVDNFECTVKDFNLEISDNDDLYNWRPVKSFQAVCGKYNQSDQVFDGFEIRARYIRLFAKNNWGPGGGSYILITDVRFHGGELDPYGQPQPQYGQPQPQYGQPQGQAPRWLDGVPRVHSYSSQHKDVRFVATNLLDKSKTYWLSETGLTTNQWVVFDFNGAANVTRISIQVSDFECTVKDFAIESSDDAYNWRNVGNFQAQCGKYNQGEQFFDFVHSGRYLRLFCRNNWGTGGGNFILVNNVRFFGSEGGQPQPQYGQPQPQYGQPQPQYGQPQYGQPQQNLAPPKTLFWLDGQCRIHSVSSLYEDGRFPATNVLDSTKTYWLAQSGQISNQWMVFDFNRPMYINKVCVQVSNFECSLKDFSIEISNNDDLYSWQSIKNFQCVNGTFNQNEQFFEGFEVRARYIRLFYKNNWGPGGGDYILVNKVRFHGNEIGAQPTPQGGIPRNLFWLDGHVRVHSSSSQHSDSTFAPSNVLDKSKTYWLSETGKVNNEWLVFDFGQSMYVNKVSIQVDDFECTVKDFNIETSDNDDLYNWRPVRSFQARCGNDCQTEQVFEGFEVRARFIRLFAKNNWGPGGGSYILITNVRFSGNECAPLVQQYGQPQPQYGQPQYGQPQPQYGQPQYGQPQPQYGQPQYGQQGSWLNNQSIRIHSFSSQHQDSRFVVQNLLDVSKTYWLSQPGLTTNQFIVFDFGKPSTITKVSIQVGNFECTVKDFNIETSDNDDTYSWRPVRSFQAIVGKNNQSEQIFEGFEARGRYLRLFAKNNWGPGGGNFILITNVKFFGF